MQHLIDLIINGGFVIIMLVVFAETGLLAGFFLPGDSLLFTAGLLIGKRVLHAPAPLPQDPLSSLLTLMGMLIAAAFVGNSTGYYVGRKAGPALYSRGDSRFFKRKHLLKTKAFYEQHGGKTLIMAEFMPFARTFAPVVAGITEMPFRKFISYNVVGVLLWIPSMLLLGYTLGDTLERFHVNPEYVIIVIVLLSIMPVILHFIKEQRQKEAGEAHQEA